ncbi:SNF2-related protein [Limnohabitans sp. Bal53]|uniref:SNF2-related protein n=1 Tax=Limnohabitans sp. Bal53 TaxID=1977910 RepID=UPI000D39DBFE|nr:SNF2-related protein [Limnohabitans sp. Bal53]PUE40276.1 helicase SNF2 [Limnohabitans sp. Bal53]
MSFFELFRRSTGGEANVSQITRSFNVEGLRFDLSESADVISSSDFLDEVHSKNISPSDCVLAAYLVQLEQEGISHFNSRGFVVQWDAVYALLEDPDHSGALQMWNLPPLSGIRPIISCTGALSDPDFELHLDGWIDGTRQIAVSNQVGGLAVVGGLSVLLSPASWETVHRISQFKNRPDALRRQHENELAWGVIREVADKAGALYTTPYLETTLVLTPSTLRLPTVKEDTTFGRVITVTPTFDRAPAEWLTAFDGFNSVQPHYDMTRGGGRVRVVISEPVRKVLEVIKREMPGRKVAGSRAEKLLRNPWSFLGESAHEVISEKEFAADRSEAGATAAYFSINPRIINGHINLVELCVTEHFGEGTARTTVQNFQTPDAFDQFIGKLENALLEDREWFGWEEFDLTIDAESSLQLEQARQFLHVWRVQPAERISLEEVYEMSGYSDRIEGIGMAKAIYVPVFQKPSPPEGQEDKGWIPDDLTPMVRVTLQGVEEQVLIPLTKQWVMDFEKQVQEAEAANQPEVVNITLPTPVSTGQARALVEGFKGMLGIQDQVKREGISKPKEKKAPKETLLVKTNFTGVDYQEERRVSLALPSGTLEVLPRSLRSEIGLKKHQLYGIAWFQHLVSKAPFECRGALLADDMGLGKTLQLLCVLAWYYEKNPNAAPSVIFAPKSLLDNWANEAKKFFTPSFPEVLVLYGDELKGRKQPLALIDSQLAAKGIIELLKPNWVGTSKIIITTYETLTSYEFSFARQPFAFVICDEAQRIKTPGTLVTLAAKKLKADFRIACTGTPVENSLADLWCLFDFVQPGLLGFLEEFGKTYRRPIECGTEDLKAALRRLQELIAPQTLRRTKADIAEELPKKYFAMKAAASEKLQFKEKLADTDRLEITLTEHQRILYLGGLKKLQDASKESDGRKRAQLSFGALHLMKAVCAEPYCLPGTKFLMDKRGMDAHLANSPKLRWMLLRLAEIKREGQKAIIFTELREAQAALSYFLREEFGLKPITINGDSQGRQASIDRFSATQGFDVIILSTLAAGAGLNVTAANHVFHFTRAWNPAKESQATDRAYRIGQELDVYVYCPTVIADFPTFEFRLDALLKKKAGLAGSTLDSDAMTEMLNGTGSEATFGDLVGTDEPGADVPKRFLTMDDVDRMDGFSFEVLCCVLWGKRGFQASVTPKRGGDGGIDVVALIGREGELIQCKSSVSEAIGWDAIKEVAAGAARYQTRFPGTKFMKFAVTNQGFTSGAITQADANRVQLVTRIQLEQMLGAHPISNHEFDNEVIGWSAQMQRAA